MFNFGVHTVKNYDHHPSWEAGYRLVGAGNQIYVLRGGRWVKQPSVIDRQRDALESATLESTRLFIHTQKIRKRKVRKDDADGAYLQAPQNTENRPVGLWAELPQCMWPDDSPAWQLRRPRHRRPDRERQIRKWHPATRSRALGSPPPGPAPFSKPRPPIPCRRRQQRQPPEGLPRHRAQPVTDQRGREQQQLAIR